MPAMNNPFHKISSPQEVMGEVPMAMVLLVVSPGVTTGTATEAKNVNERRAWGVKIPLVPPCVWSWWKREIEGAGHR